MQIPKLQYSNRSREYNICDEEIRDKIIYGYLFEGKSHRKLDEEYIKVNSDYSRGWQSMGVLHYMGIRKEFKGIFSEIDIIDVIKELRKLNDTNYNLLIESLERCFISICSEIIAKDIELESEEFHQVIDIISQNEGKKISYYTTRYERNIKNRTRAIEIHGTKCMACGFDFEKVYGELGRAYIEVHHVSPLSSIEDEVKINPKTDLIAVCSNCHRMIHRKKNHVLSLEELKNIIEKN
ncbi:HNH endonuclease [Clostridium frigidicarnis]|uniref:HNH endonuclease n=1 Tax=Clostridium frigidicarnis TaxID=84698 RepID=A0A1I1AQH4_9CLOT|nr:HNH endonuclease [Clostridium frigidicarnis]SFB38593.1 HNH endonuclease [Clostridium frigidicarnis]